MDAFGFVGLLAIGGLIGIAIILKTLEYLLEWVGMAIDELGEALATIIIFVLLSPVLIPYALYKRWRKKKTRLQPALRARTVVTRRQVTTIVAKEQIVIWKGTPGQAMRPVKVFYPGPNTVPPEVAERTNLELIREKEQRDARR